MNTSKIDTLAMAAETRAKLHVYEAPMAMSPSAGQRAAVASSRYGVGAADVSPTIGAAALGVAQSPVKSGSRPRACSGFPSNKRKAASFAEKLHAILADRNASSTITWLPSGKSFCIMDKQEFTRRVLPLYFREAKFEVRDNVPQSIQSHDHNSYLISFSSSTTLFGIHRVSHADSSGGASVRYILRVKSRSFLRMTCFRRAGLTCARQ
jgi:hypothetical protein